MLLSTNFSYDEIVVSELAVRRGIDNRPPAEILDRLKATAQNLERVRAILGAELRITAGYACAKLNAAMGRPSSSAHIWGWAVNFVCPPAGQPLAVCRKLADADIEFDVLAHEYGAWVHLSFDPRARGQVLTLDRQGWRQGLHVVRPAPA